MTPKQLAGKNERQRERRRENGNADTRRYERTKAGFLMRLYRNMQSRVEGVQYHKAHLYEGLFLLPRSAFYEWAMGSPEFHTLWDEWTAADRDRRLVPTVDRADPEKGYAVSNMEWATHSENSRRGALSRHKRFAATIVKVHL